MQNLKKDSKAKIDSTEYGDDCLYHDTEFTDFDFLDHELDKNDKKKRERVKKVFNINLKRTYSVDGKYFGGISKKEVKYNHLYKPFAMKFLYIMENINPRKKKRTSST